MFKLLSVKWSFLRVRSGDHTVKLICCQTGRCVRTLLGHRRTPWVVRLRTDKARTNGILYHLNGEASAGSRATRTG